MRSNQTLHRTSRWGRPRRLGAVTATALMAGGLFAVGAGPAAAEPATVANVTLEWAFNPEIGLHAPPFGGCNFLSAGQSDGSQGQYQTTVGNVSVLKDGAAPDWATKCNGASTGTLNQSVRWTGGAGTVDPDTGEVSVTFPGAASINFYGGLVPFTITNPVLTVDAGGNGQIVATVFGYASSMENPEVKEPLPPAPGIVVADLSNVASGNELGFTVTPDYAGVEYEPPAGSGGTPQNRTTPGWGSWPESFVDYHYETGLSSYWYHSGGGADPKKAPSPLTITYNVGDEGPGEPGEPGDGTQTIVATVPESTGAGELIWSIDGDATVDLGETTDEGTYLQATGSIDPILVSDTRDERGQWSVTGQVGSFTGGVSGSHLGWAPQVLAAGAGAVAGDVVASSLNGGTTGLTAPSVLAASPGGHAAGTATLGAALDLRLPPETEAGSYTATLTITALS